MDKKKRLFYIDYYRAIIVLLMIQGHTLRALLSNSIKTGKWFYIHEFIHGAVAPGFLFLSGFLFYHTIKNKTFIDYINKLYAYIGIIVIGYFLHLPFLSFKKLSNLWDTNIKNGFLQIDILQTIGFSLLLSLFAWILLKKHFNIFLLLIIIFNLYYLFFPFKINNFFLSFFFDNQLSPFPVFPWSIYFFTGVFANRYFKNFNIKLLIFSTLLLSLQIFFEGVRIERIADIGKILFLLSVSQFFLNKDYKSLKLFLRASRESLFLYTSHIMIVYGSVLNKGLNYYFNNSLNFYQFTIVFLCLSLLVYSAAYLINMIKHNNPEFYGIAKYSLYSVFLYLFFTRSW
jgi:hypothetical protein